MSIRTWAPEMRRPARPQRPLARGRLRRGALQVREDLRHQLRLLDVGDDLQLPTTTRTPKTPEEVKKAHPKNILKRGRVVFNIEANDFRLIALVQ
jgi:hypothetical protein